MRPVTALRPARQQQREWPAKPDYRAQPEGRRTLAADRVSAFVRNLAADLPALGRRWTPPPPNTAQCSFFHPAQTGSQNNFSF